MIDRVGDFSAAEGDRLAIAIGVPGRVAQLGAFGDLAGAASASSGIVYNDAHAVGVAQIGSSTALFWVSGGEFQGVSLENVAASSVATDCFI